MGDAVYQWHGPISLQATDNWDNYFYLIYFEKTVWHNRTEIKIYYSVACFNFWSADLVMPFIVMPHIRRKANIVTLLLGVDKSVCFMNDNNC